MHVEMNERLVVVQVTVDDEPALVVHERRGEKGDHNVGWMPRLIHVTVFSCLALTERDARQDMGNCQQD